MTIHPFSTKVRGPRAPNLSFYDRFCPLRHQLVVHTEDAQHAVGVSDLGMNRRVRGRGEGTDLGKEGKETVSRYASKNTSLTKIFVVCTFINKT